MGYCRECGAYNDEGSLFCASCGTPLVTPDSAAETASDTSSPEEKPYEAVPDQDQQTMYDGGSEQGNYDYSEQYDYQSSYGAKPGIMDIYQKAFAVLIKKPFRLWGISLLSGLITFVLGLLFGFALGIGICIDILITVGMTMVFLHGYRGEEVHAVQLFDAFKDGATIKRTLGGMAWTYMWIFLWALIPIVGPIFAIIRAYEYRLTPYILVTEPDIKATDALKVSKERTEGWKLKMFCADLLIGVIIFAVLIVLNILTHIPVIGILFSIIFALVTIICMLFSELFCGLVHAAFYEEIRVRL